MLGRLSVVIDDGTTRHRVVTRNVHGLEFTKVAQGGDHSCRMSVDVPAGDFPNLGPADRVHIDDAVTGRRLFTGYTENPGRRPGGFGFELAAMGGMVLARDESRPLVYIDRQLDSWQRDPSPSMPASAAVESGDHPNNLTTHPGWRTQFNPGLPVSTSYFAQVAYHVFNRIGMEFGGIRLGVSGGKTDPDWATRVAWNGAGGAGTTIGNTLTTTRTVYEYRTGASIPTGTTMLALALARAGGATNVADDLTWAFWDDLAILGRRMDRTGTLLDGAALGSLEYVTASAVVEDLLGRLLGRFVDITTATVEPTSGQIDQLAYIDGTTAGDVLNDLTLWEPDMLWQIGAHLPNGRHTFAYRAWPTTPRYEIGRRDDYTAPGGEVDLCNRIAVYWNDAAGNQQTTVVTSDVPELGTRIKDAPSITLPDGKGSEANAVAVGTQKLEAMKRPANAGTAVVRRPIFDHLWQRMVMPWELEPGHLATVMETGELLRITETEYVDADCATRLTLGEPILSDEQRFARLEAVR